MYQHLKLNKLLTISTSLGIITILLTTIEKLKADSHISARQREVKSSNTINSFDSITKTEPNVTSQTKSETKKLDLIPKSLDLVKELEGFSQQAYIDTDGTVIIGYGQPEIAGRTVLLGDRISQTDAEAALAKELKQIQQEILDSTEVDLNANQLAALTSLSFNVGFEFISDSTLIEKLNAGDYHGTANEFGRWNKADVNGRIVTLDGLTRRREIERQLFVTPATLLTNK